MNLEAQELEHTVLELKEKDPTDGTQATKIKVATNQEKAKALVLLRLHIHDSLKSECLFIKDFQKNCGTPLLKDLITTKGCFFHKLAMSGRI